MAKQLVSAMTGEFDPAQYKDEYREALEKIIEAKVEGQETVEIEEPEETGKLVDLMAALEASVYGRQGRPRLRSREARVGGRGTREEGGSQACRVQGTCQGLGRGGEGEAGRSEAQDGELGASGGFCRAAAATPATAIASGPLPAADCQRAYCQQADCQIFAGRIPRHEIRGC
jgi:DNA end-binding protein Ku